MVLFAQLLSRLLTLLCVVTLIFLLIHLVPGDPVTALLGDQATVADHTTLRQSLGLDLPLGQQYVMYITNLLHGDLGTSLVRPQPVAALIAERAGPTVVLALAAMGVALVVGLAGGISLAMGKVYARQSVWPNVLDTTLLAVLTTPTFCLGPVLVLVCAVGLGWLPVSGYDSPASFILPALTLGLGLGAHLARLLAASLENELTADYMQTARAKGAPLMARINRHALPNACVPVVIMFCLQLGMVLTGTVLTEAVFGWPGLGSLLVEALHGRDYPVIQALLLVISLTYMASLVLGDALAARLDPRLRG